MTEQKSNKQSWWVSLPGIITAIATLLTSTGGVIAILSSSGIIKEMNLFSKPNDKPKVEQSVTNDSNSKAINQTHKTDNGQPSNTHNTTSINIAYKGDQHGCNLPITITIGTKHFSPNSNPFVISDIPLGMQPYEISGEVNCPSLGGPRPATGHGTINVTSNATFYVYWNDGEYGQCHVELLEN